MKYESELYISILCVSVYTFRTIFDSECSIEASMCNDWLLTPVYIYIENRLACLNNTASGIDAFNTS